jgi:phosphoribosylanthranilate isomerase
MTWVKICGTTNLEDALLATDAGADAVGFVFYEKSPRCIKIEMARQIVEELPEHVEKIGVFVSGSGADPMEVMSRVGLTGTQSYTAEAPQVDGGFFKAARVSSLPQRARFLMALPMNVVGASEAQLQNLAEVLVEWKKKLDETSPAAERLIGTFVMDSGNLQMPGGTGKTFDWGKAAPFVERMVQAGVKLVVAGGLTEENISEAIEILRPWGVDVASGVESRPGKKDPEKVRAFLRAVREIDRKVV